MTCIARVFRGPVITADVHALVTQTRAMGGAVEPVSSLSCLLVPYSTNHHIDFYRKYPKLLIHVASRKLQYKILRYFP